MVSNTRSARDTLSKKTPPTTPIAGSRKSERLEKKTSTPPPSLAAPAKVNPAKKNKNEKSVVATPLRRSERTNKSISSPASSSTSSPKSSASTSKKKRKFAEEKEVSEEEEEQDFGTSSRVKKKRLNALVYRAGLRKAEPDCVEESSKMDKSTQKDVSSGGGRIPEDMVPSEDAKAKEAIAESRLTEPVKEFSEDNVTNDTRKDASEETERDLSDFFGEETSFLLTSESGLNGPVKEISENNATLGLLVPSKVANNETSEASGRKQSDCRVEETSQMLDSRMNGPVKELSENNATLVSSAPSDATDNKTSVAPECDQSDNHKDEKSQLLLSRNFGSNATLIRSCVGNDIGENLISKRKGTMMNMHSDVSTTLVDVDNCNLIADPEPFKLCDKNAVSNGSCSKRIRQISSSDVQSDQRELINNVDQLSSKSEDVKLSTENEEERPQGNDIEHIRKQQRSLHLSLKPKMAKLCEILHLPDNVKNMVDNCLEYIMNNRQICTEPLKLFQAFQLSLCWIAASLLHYKLDFDASVKLAKRHLNFSCKKDVVNQIYTRLWELKEEILFHVGNPVVTDSPKASEPSNRFYSCTEMAKSKSTKEIQKCENQLGKVLQTQQGETQKLKADIEQERDDFLRRYQIEWAAIQRCSSTSNDQMRREKLKFFKNEYGKRYYELKRQHETRLKDLRAMQVEARQKFEDSRERGEFLPDSSKEHETEIEEMQTCGQAESQNSPKNAACMSDHLDEGNIIAKHANSRESCSDVAVNTADEGEGFGNFSRESHNDFGQDNSAVVLLSSNGEISDRRTSDVPNVEAAPLMSKMGISNDDQEVLSSNQGKLDRTILRKPGCGLSVEVKEGFRDEVKNNASSNSQSSVEHIPNCDNAAQIHEVDNNDSNNGETPKLPLSDERPCGGAVNNSVLDREFSRPCGIANPIDGSDANATVILNQDPLEKQNPDGVSSSMPAEQVTVEVPEIGHEGASVSISDRESPAGMATTVSCCDHPVNITPLDPSSMDQISDGASVLEGNLSSRSCGMSSPSNGLALAPLNPTSLQQPDRVSLSRPCDQIPVIVLETSHEVAECQLTDTVMLDRNTTSDQQEGVQRTMPEITSTQEAPVPRPASHTEPPEQVQPLSPVQSPDEPDTARETQNSLVSGPVDIVPANQPNHDSLVVKPPVQVPQLTFEDLSSHQDLPSLPSVPSLPSATGIEHQRTNEDTHSSHIAEATIEVPNQAAEQHASNLESDSQSHRVVHTTSNLDSSSPLSVGVRMQSSDMRNLSSTSDINNQPIQTTQSTSRNAPPVFRDPLKNEMERISKLADDNLKNHEDKKLQFKSDYEKEYEELRKKYEVKLHDSEVEFQQQRKELDTQFKTVLVNKALADAFRYKCLDHKASSTSGMSQDPSFAHQLFQLISQQLSTWPPPVAGSSYSGPPAANLQSSYTTSRSHPVIPPPPPQPYTTSSSQTMVPPPPRPQTTSRSHPVVSPPPLRPHTTSSSQTLVPPPSRPQITSRSHPVVPPPPVVPSPQRPNTTSRSHPVVSPPPPRPPTTSSSQPVVPPSQRPHTTSRSHPMVPPPQRPTYNTSAIFSSVSPGLPYNNSIPSPYRNFEVGGDIRSPAPHLQPRRPPSMSVPASTNLCTAPPGIPSSTASTTIPLNPPPFSRQHPSPLSRTKSTNQSDPHKVPQPTSSGGLPTPNLNGSDSRIDPNIQSGINPPNIMPRLSELAKLDILKDGTRSSRPANSPLQGTSSDVVCLSDDE